MKPGHYQVGLLKNKNKMLHRAVEREFEIIGEAMKEILLHYEFFVCFFGKQFGIADKPYPRMSIQNNHFNASQSSSPTGIVGSSYLMTELRSGFNKTLYRYLS